jgi:hypothetical protein
MLKATPTNDSTRQTQTFFIENLRMSKATNLQQELPALHGHGGRAGVRWEPASGENKLSKVANRFGVKR